MVSSNSTTNIDTCIHTWIYECRDEIIATYSNLLRIPAISPESGGKGEFQKAEHIKTLFSKWGWTLQDLKEVPIPDTRAEHGIRPNLIFTYNPTHSPHPPLCLVSHLDVVPTGDPALWTNPPFTPTIHEGKLYARGAEDNGQGVIATIFALKCIKDLRFNPNRPIQLVLVSDEELGSTYGIKPLVSQGLFPTDALVIVPDSGDSTGLPIQIAEKVGVHIHLLVEGKQGHAAGPKNACNAHRVMNELIVEIDHSLHETFTQEDPLFRGGTTMEPTKRITPGMSVNVIPGVDEAWFDCRLIPAHSKKSIQSIVEGICTAKMQISGAKITVTVTGRDEPIKPIDTNNLGIQLLKQAITKVLPGDPYFVGIGGGTCAAFFREKGIPAVVWGHMAHLAHMIDEYCVIDYLLQDIEIYAHLYLL